MNDLNGSNVNEIGGRFLCLRDVTNKKIQAPGFASEDIGEPAETNEV